MQGRADVEETRTLVKLRGEVNAVIQSWRDAGRFTTRSDAWLTGYDRDFTRALGERGLIGVAWPVDLGGRGLNARARVAVVEELLRHGAPVAAHWIAERQIGPALLRYGTPELQQKYLPGIASGEVTFALGLSESEAGSDLAALRTRATDVEGGWRLNGTKVWTSHAHRSDYLYILARTHEGERPQQGLTEFILPTGAPGVTVEPILDMRGRHHFNQVVLEDVFVPEDHVIGEVGDGWRQATEQLAFERGGIERVMSTYPLVDHLIRHAGASTDRVVREQLGGLLARFDALRTLAWSVASQMDRGEAPMTEAATLKLLGTEFERDVLEVARRLLRDVVADPTADGLSGLLAEGILAAPGFSIRGGTTEMLLRIIGRGEVRP